MARSPAPEGGGDATRIMAEYGLHPTVEASTFVDILRKRARHQPNQRAYTFLVGEDPKELYLTYGELDGAARAIAACLQRLGMQGERALLLYPPGLDYIAAFFGCLYARIIAVPAYLPDPARLNRTLPRLQAIMQDAQVAVVLTLSSLLTSLEPLLMQAPHLPGLRWVVSDQIVGERADDWREPSPLEGEIALLQYTSGSTGWPRGVMVSHQNLLHNSAHICRAFEHTASSVVVSWLPPFHDMGLIFGVLQPLFKGFPGILMPPTSFLERPARWLEAISAYRATTSGGPNFAYDLCVRKTTPEQRASLDLSSWGVAFNGAEPIRLETMQRFAAAFQPCGFRPEALWPSYGLAEATLFVAGNARTSPIVSKIVQAAALEKGQAVDATPSGEKVRTLVSCGKTLPDQQIVIVHPEHLTRCTWGEVGEVWVSGASVCLGYWNKAQETTCTFQAYLADTGEGPFLRTGDLGFVQQGQLFITGRLKDLIILRGRNLYPQDIELTFERSHPALRSGCGAAFSVEAEEEEQLVIIQELQRTYQGEFDLIVQAIHRRVMEEHEIQIHTIVLLKEGSIPKTSSGKIQRHACRASFLAGSLEVVCIRSLADFLPYIQQASVTEQALPAAAPEERLQLIEKYLCEQIAHLLKVSATRLKPGIPLTALLDSLASYELKNAIEEKFRIILPVTALLGGKSSAEVATEILGRLEMASMIPEEKVAPAAEETLVEYPLSHGQKALWFLHQLAPESPVYNLPLAFRIRTDLNISALRQSFQALLERHPSLRTTFTTQHGEPTQRVSKDGVLCFQVEDASSWSQTQINTFLQAEAYRLFDLEHSPLLRVSLLTRSAQESLLLLVVHHLIADFWSLATLMQELCILYAAKAAGKTAVLSPLPQRYSDYVHWQRAVAERPETAKHWAYWQQELSGTPPLLNLPADHQRPRVQTYHGAVHTFKLSSQLTEGLIALSQEQGATLYMTLLAGLQLLLFRYTCQEDIIVGSLTGGRNRGEWADVIGYFVNPVALRTDFSGNPTFQEVLAQVRRKVLGALEHQDYPYDLLVERLRPLRDPSYPPLFQVMLNWPKTRTVGEQNLASFALGEKMTVAGLVLEPVTLEQCIARFDLTAYIAEFENSLGVSLEYNTDLFEAGTIRHLAELFQALLEAVVAAPERPVMSLPFLTDYEQHLLTEWNATQAEYPKDRCLHELFEAQVQRTPERIAVSYEGQSLTYRELNQRANQLAHLLGEAGVKPGVLVGIYVERSLDISIGLLGILKAGAAYVPLDPGYPRARLVFMLHDAQPLVVLTQAHLRAHLPEYGGPVICLDADWQMIAQQSSENLTHQMSAGDLAYVIFTSGSTGRPKGVQVPHTALVNCLYALYRQLGLSEQDTLLAVTPFSFDIAALELFLPLLGGARTALASRKAATDGALLVQELSASGATIMQATPATWRLLLAAGWSGNRAMTCLCGGEALSQDLADALLERVAALWNLYGPTETTIWSTADQIERSGEPISIGRPLNNTQIYLLDAQLHPVPIGVPGEIYIGGVGLAHGYLHRPDLTSECFILDPFREERGARLYKSGDLGRWRQDGKLEWLGRLDQQIKLRGYRIEPGEIEALLCQHPAIRESVVIAHEVSPGDKRLIAYMVPSSDQHRWKRHLLARERGKEQEAFSTSFQPGRPATEVVSALRRFLQEQLPEYMIPTTFMVLEALPLTPSRKVDRGALPIPETGSEEDPFVAPSTQTEELLCEIWAEVLGLEHVGIHDDFFALGGHSLLTLQVLARLVERTGIELPVQVLFEQPTPTGLAQRIEETLVSKQTEQRPLGVARRLRRGRMQRRRREPYV